MAIRLGISKREIDVFKRFIPKRPNGFSDSVLLPLLFHYGLDVIPDFLCRHIKAGRHSQEVFVLSKELRRQVPGVHRLGTDCVPGQVAGIAHGFIQLPVDNRCHNSL